MTNDAGRPVSEEFKNYINKYTPLVRKVCGYVFQWKVFWFLVFVFICTSIFYPPVGDIVINFSARQKSPFVKLPANAKMDFNTTVVYKREKLTVVGTNLRNVLHIIERDLGLREVENTKLVSVSTNMPVSTDIEKTFVPPSTDTPVKGDLSMITDNLVDAFKAYLYMLTVRIVTIDNKPVIIDNNGNLVPFDKTDKILQWAGFIETAAKKYKIDPAIIAAIIEQESGGDAVVVSHAGAVGLMQLMPRTAGGLGVNPYDPAQNIDGGTRYFLYQYRAFGNIEQALAAYNAGPGNVRNGNYLFIPETQRYVANVPRLVEKYQRLFAQARKK